MTLTAQYRPYRDEEGLDGLDNDHMAWSDHEPGTIQIYEKTTEELPFTSNRRLMFGVISLSILTLLTGFLIGYFAHTKHIECVPNLSLSLHAVRDENPTIRAKILANIDSDSIRSVVREFSSQPHMAGSLNDLKLAVQTKDFLHAHNFDKVLIKNYTVLLSFPDYENPNYIEIIDESTNQTLYSSLNNNMKGTNYSYAYCAYSPSADIRGDIIFVNYGRLSDYQILHTVYNISRDVIAGKILIAKQFHITADEQLMYAQQMGASGLLLYPDPEHYNPPQLNLKPFPDSPYLPSDAVRLDSLLWNGAGDPLTPGYPATPSALRMPLRSLQMPSIPVQPISYDMAHEILQRLDGKEAPNKWRGGLNMSYHLGPGFLNNTKLKLHLKVNNQLVNKTIHNVIGTIKGIIEPDRYVIVGNHRDAWFKGAVDASAGTAAFLELSKVFGDLLKDGFRPRRSILFCSWGAEEFNLIGSTEWLEEHMKILHGRAIAYINSDIIVIGNGSLSVAASPLLYHAVFNATKQVPNPNDEEEAKTVYDKWLISHTLMRNKSDMLFNSGTKRNTFEDFDFEPNLLNTNKHFNTEEPNEYGSILKSYMESAMQEIRPKVRHLDMRSPYSPFFSMAGIPAVDITYANINHLKNDGKSINFMSYPLLHTKYDTVKLIENFIDTDYKYHKAVTQVLGEIIRDLADSLFIPFNLLDYAQVLTDFYITLHIHTDTILSNNGVNIEILESAIENFTTAAIHFHKRQDELDLRDPMAIRRVNDQLLLIERAFLDQNGLPRNMIKRHIILSPSETNPPYDEMFPGLMDEFTLLLQQSDTKNTGSWDIIRAHFSILVFTIQSAADTISDVV